MSPEQFANAKNDSRHHGSSTKVTRVALQSKKDSKAQLTKNQIGYCFPRSQREKLWSTSFYYIILSIFQTIQHFFLKKVSGNWIMVKFAMWTYHKEHREPMGPVASSHEGMLHAAHSLASWWSVIIRLGLKYLASLSFGFVTQKPRAWWGWLWTC